MKTLHIRNTATFVAGLALTAFQVTAAEIRIGPASVASVAPAATIYPNQVPHSRVARGERNIAVA